MSKNIGVAEVKKQFSAVISEVSLKGEHFVIEKKGKPMAAMVSVKELEMIEGSGTKEKKRNTADRAGFEARIDSNVLRLDSHYRQYETFFEGLRTCNGRLAQ